MIRLRAAGAAAVICASVAVVSPRTPAAAATPDLSVLRLPAPVTTLPTFPGIGLRPDRRLFSHVPSTVQTHEDVAVALDGTGQPVAVQLDEHLHVDGTGAYLIYERGPARAAVPLDNSLPPVLELGTVVWQGFSPGGRDLAARLRLDPTLEAQRLPLRVQLSFMPAGSPNAQPLAANGTVPGPGTVNVQITNTTGTPRQVPTGTAAPTRLADPLTRLLETARTSRTHPTRPVALPTAGNGLPRQLPATKVGSTVAVVPAPMRVVGSISAPGTTARLSGPTARNIPGGGLVNGVLSDMAAFTLAVPQAGRVAINLTATPTLDERTLQPPDGQPSWHAWARGAVPSVVARSATDQLVAGAAAAARGAELSPYVGSDTRGTATTQFRFTISATKSVASAAEHLHPHPLAIGIVGLAGLVAVSGAAALWRRS